MARRLLIVLMGAVLVLGAACGDDGGTEPQANDTETDTEEPTEEPTEAEAGAITITGTDFAFKTPATVPAGETEITFVNEGKENHFLQMVPLADGAPDVEELLKLPEKKAESYFAGKPINIKTIKPGESDSVTADLQPGTYGMVCFVFSKEEKKPHAFLGMFNSLIVE